MLHTFFYKNIKLLTHQNLLFLLIKISSYIANETFLSQQEAIVDV